MSGKAIRVLLAKKKIDVHGRGSKLIARELRDAGMEVIYYRFGTVNDIVNTAIQEDVDVIGLSLLSGAHMTLFVRVLDILKREGVEDILVTGGGIIPDEDKAALHDMGMGKLFGPGTPVQDIVDYIRETVDPDAKA